MTRELLTGLAVPDRADGSDPARTACIGHTWAAGGSLRPADLASPLVTDFLQRPV